MLDQFSLKSITIYYNTYRPNKIAIFFYRVYLIHYNIGDLILIDLIKYLTY